MPSATRKGDVGSGHGCFPPSNSIAGSADVFINGKPAMRVGDAYAAHGCGKCAPHGRAAAAGSATVFINGKAAVRIGDAITCGGAAASGSPNVNIGDLSWGGQETLPSQLTLKYQLTQSPGSLSSPYIYEPYKLYHNGSLIQEGSTDEEGGITFEAEPPVTGSYKVELQNGTIIDLPVEGAPPADSEPGRDSRRKSLGYGADQPEGDGSDDPDDHLKGLIP